MNIQNHQKQKKLKNSLKTLSNTQLYTDFLKNLENFIARETCAVAVSGGGDSVALLCLFAVLKGSENVSAVHFNHGFRVESDAEEAWLAEICDEMGIQFISEKWSHENGELEGNKQQAARRARYDFFAKSCKKHGFENVFVAHNRDDVVETMLMRLGRGSGLKGLAAMEGQCEIQGVKVARPLLFASRDAIREALNTCEIPYLNDPSNEDDTFFRVRVRKLKNQMEEAGLNFDAMAASASALRRAENALKQLVQTKSALYTRYEEQVIVISNDFSDESAELSARLLGKWILELNPQPLAPRTSKRQSAFEKMKKGEKKFTLGGVEFLLQSDEYHLRKV